MNCRHLFDIIRSFTVLPSSNGGYLSYWMLFMSSLAILNSMPNFVTTKLMRKMYNKAPASVNGLQARTFVIWTLASAAIRIQAAYNIDSKPLYDLALGSYVLALAHIVIEAVVFRTAGFGPGLASPVIVASTSLVWMTRQYDFYVRA